ncbi:hypothetical protein HYE67_003047 [Fusarium culmorum]|uniref:Uncharacterized protein n=1 Tax=Fusarium culmorum TaxID=5516 RepID=A0A7S8D2K6_FUSCU|nr:hypothetical protein HYE67_003047 [Fusarium culmorum]
MTSQSGSISEDWEELSNVGSVTSLDGESKSTSTASVETQTPAIVSPTVAGPSSAHMQLPLRPKQDETVYSQLSSSTGPQWDTWGAVPPSGDLPYQPFQHGKSTRTNTSMSMGAGVPSIIQNGRTSAQEGEGFWFGDGFDNLVLKDPQTRYDVYRNPIDPCDNPRSRYDACIAAQDLLVKVSRLAQNIGSRGNSVASNTYETCERLLVQTTELLVMLSAYNEYWKKSNGKTLNSPFRPQPCELLFKLERKLRMAEAELRGGTKAPLYVNSRRVILPGESPGCDVDLKNISTEFADTMPTLRADFELFRLIQMDVQPATTGTSKKLGRRVPQNPEVGRICKELDVLKASLVSLSAFLKQLRSNGECKYVMGPPVTNTVDSIIDVIAKTPTLYPLGWADSAAKGGLNYSQVVELSEGCIREPVRDLKYYQREIDIAPDVPGYQPCQLRFDVAMKGIRDVVEVLEVLLLDPIRSD